MVVGMRVSFLLGFAVFCMAGSAWAQNTLQLWPDGVLPYSKPHSVEEYEAPCWHDRCAYQVVEPELTIYPAQGNDAGAVVLVLPGGGYEVLSVYNEGHDIARALSALGVDAVVLKYRLPNPHTATRPENVPLSDVRQALHRLRTERSQMGLTGRKVGVLGFSAAAHLATMASLFPVASPHQRPDFSVLVYGVTRMTAENRQWLEKTLYHREMTPEELRQQTLLERVDEHTPPAFLVHAMDDKTCHYSETTLYAEALTAHGVPAETILFATGGHGFGPGRAADGTDQWLGLAVNWLGRLVAETEGG